jgi:hypothetical protein
MDPLIQWEIVHSLKLILGNIIPKEYFDEDWRLKDLFY